MTPGVAPDERNFESQMGCMAGFLQIFDRHQILAGKRPYAAKRLYPAAGSTSPSERSESSVSSSFLMRDSKPTPSPEVYSFSPESPAPAETPAKPKVPPPVIEFKDGLRSSWKLQQAPRLSLDSRAVVDGKGKLRPREIRTSKNSSDAGDDFDQQRRSPSVVARLMGLEVLPGGAAGEKTAELRRSASESRISSDSSLFRFVESSKFQKAPPTGGAVMYRTAGTKMDLGDTKPTGPARASLAASLQRKSYFDAQDFFPEPKRTGSLYGEIERRLRMRGIDEPAKDLETLKQVLEALQFKGLLHSNLHPQDNQIIGVGSRRGSNAVFDRRYPVRSPGRGDSPIVVMRPARKSPKKPGSESPPPPTRSSPPAQRRGAPESGTPPRARCTEPVRSPRGRNRRSPDRPEASRYPAPTASRRTANATPPPPQRRNPVHSPRTSPKRTGLDPSAVRSPRNRRAMPEPPRNVGIYSPAVEDDSSTTISESSISNSSQYEFERLRVEDHRTGRSLLDRCDKLLHSIAAITSPAEQLAAADQQPSPVSVLDASSFLGADETSPAVKRSVDFKDQPGVWEELVDHWPSSVRSIHVDGPGLPEDPDVAYVSDILTALDTHTDPSDVYAALEKRHLTRSQPSDSSPHLHGRLLFDVVAEILDRRRSVPTWDAYSRASPLAAPGGPELLRQVWAEVRRARDGVLSATDELNDVTCGAIRKDMAAAGDRGWDGACAAEMSNAVLYIERQIFKDLVADTIRDLAAVAQPPRRKLLF